MLLPRQREEIATPQYSSAQGHYLSGDWDDAIAEFEASHALAQECGSRHGMVCNGAVRALIALHRGDPTAPGGPRQRR